MKTWQKISIISGIIIILFVCISIVALYYFYIKQPDTKTTKSVHTSNRRRKRTPSVKQELITESITETPITTPIITPITTTTMIESIPTSETTQVMPQISTINQETSLDLKNKYFPNPQVESLSCNGSNFPQITNTLVGSIEKLLNINGKIFKLGSSTSQSYLMINNINLTTNTADIYLNIPTNNLVYKDCSV